MKGADKIKAFFRRKPKVFKEKPPQEAEKKPSEPVSITEKQGLNGIIVLQKGTKS